MPGRFTFYLYTSPFQPRLSRSCFLARVCARERRKENENIIAWSARASCINASIAVLSSLFLHPSTPLSHPFPCRVSRQPAGGCTNNDIHNVRVTSNGLVTVPCLAYTARFFLRSSVYRHVGRLSLSREPADRKPEGILKRNCVTRIIHGDRSSCRVWWQWLSLLNTLPDEYVTGSNGWLRAKGVIYECKG